MMSRIASRAGFLAATVSLALLMMGCPLHKVKKCAVISAPPTLAALGNSKAAWGDFDNDGDLDVVIAGSLTSSGPTPSTKLYRNNGSGGFTEVTGAGFLDVYNADLCWVDLDNDGFVDLILSGTNASGNPETHIYQNNGNGTFTDKGNCGLPDIQSGTIRAGDSNHDGLYDLAVMGDDGDGLVAEVFYNNFNFTFFAQGANITAVVGTLEWVDMNDNGTWGVLVTGTPNGIYDDSLQLRFYWDTGDGWDWNDVTNDHFTGLAMTLGDFNNDGLVDLAIAGYDDSDNEIARVYFNDGEGGFYDVGAGLTAAGNGSVACGDFDNDGFLDLVVMGTSTGSQASAQTILYFGDGNGNFTDSGVVLRGAAYGCVAVADYNRDTALDFILMGFDPSNVPFTTLIRNQSGTTNAKPLAPVSLFANTSGPDVTIFWGGDSDDHTSSSSLSFNVRVGSSPGGNDILSGQANSNNGFRRIVGPGNGSHRNSIDLYNLADGTYFYSVQAIDGSWEGGDWASEQSFTIFNNNGIHAEAAQGK